MLDPNLLRKVFTEVMEKTLSGQPMDARLAHLNLVAQDGSLWSALPRMAWAEYGVGRHGDAKGVRLHLRFHLLEDKPVDARVTRGKDCERQALRQMCVAGQTNVGDRYYGEDYQLFGEIDRARAFFVIRIKEDAVVHVEEELALSEQDSGASGLGASGGPAKEPQHALAFGGDSGGRPTSAAGHQLAGGQRELGDGGRHLPPPLVHRAVFPLNQVHSGLPAFLCRIARGSGPPALSGLDCGPALSTLRRSPSQQGQLGTHSDGRVAAKEPLATSAAQKILRTHGRNCGLAAFGAQLCTEGFARAKRRARFSPLRSFPAGHTLTSSSSAEHN